jgi:gliding motility-associated-like protein
MNHLKNTITILASAILLFPACRKSKDNVDIHCRNLENNTPASDPAEVYVANAFTPNLDGINDGFKVDHTGISTIAIKVYDKNSSLVYQADQLNASWDYFPSTGKNEKFYYRVEAVTQSGNKIGVCGEVNSLICLPPNTAHTFYFRDQLTPQGFTGVTAETIGNCN